MTALLTVFYDDKETVIRYIEECKRMGIDVLPPDINHSAQGFTIEGDRALRFGLGSILGLGQAVIDVIMEKRPFLRVEEIIERIPKRQLNKKTLRVLVLSGALDSLMPQGITNRMELLQLLYFLRGDKDDLSDEIKNFSTRLQLEYEKEFLGLYLSGHPLAEHAQPVRWDMLADYEKVDTAGYITSFKEIQTRKGEPMAMLNVETMEGNKRMVIFPSVYKDVQGQLQKDLIIKVRVYKKYNPQYDEHSIIVDKITIPKRANKHLL